MQNDTASSSDIQFEHSESTRYMGHSLSSEMFEKLVREVRIKLSSLGVEESDARDLVNAALLRLENQWNILFRPEEESRLFAAVVIRSRWAWLDLHRDEARIAQVSDLPPDDNEDIDRAAWSDNSGRDRFYQDEPEASLIEKEDEQMYHEALIQSLQILKGNQEKVMKLSILEGKTVIEIAEFLRGGTSKSDQNWVHKTMGRAKKKMTDHLLTIIDFYP